MNKKQALKEYIKMPWHFCTEQTEWEGEQGFWVSVAELPNCSTFAPTIEEGLITISRLLPTYIDTALESNSKIPLPNMPEAEEVGGKLNLRIPKSLHLGLKKAAERECISLNQFAVFALTKSIYETMPSRAEPAAIKRQAKTTITKLTIKTPIKKRT